MQSTAKGKYILTVNFLTKAHAQGCTLRKTFAAGSLFFVPGLSCMVESQLGVSLMTIALPFCVFLLPKESKIVLNYENNDHSKKSKILMVERIKACVNILNPRFTTLLLSS